MIKSKKKINKKIKKIKKQNGGHIGTSGDISTLVSDIAALAKSVVNTIVNTSELVVEIIELPYDMVKKIPYKYPATPGSEL